MRIDELREKANRLPLLPGVYIMLDEKGEVIYVGKAKALKNRVVSYFRGEHLPKVAAMVEKVRDFNVIVAASEFEALVLENSLIKRHQPHYNILLRDDKGYPFVRLDRRSEYPKFTITNRTAEDGASYFGPFGGRSQTHDVIDTICKALKLPTCSRVFPRDIGRERPCLNHHMGNCRGYCLKDSSAEEYRASIADAVLILEGKSDELEKQLEADMMKAAGELRFELAAELRDRLRAVSTLGNRQRVIAATRADTDAVGWFRGAKCCLAVLHYRDGNLVDKDYELMDEPLEDDGEVISAFVRQYYERRGHFPKNILLPCDCDDRESMEQFLSEQGGKRVYVEVPKRGDRLRLVERANVNAKEECSRVTTAAQRRNKTLEWLQRTLELPELPSRIEAFDVSNIGNFGIVAAMTVFKDGKPLKRDYRKFKIHDTATQDDYHSMREAVLRRFRHWSEGDEGFGALPDLLLIDGGSVHAAAALEVLRELGLTVPVYGMVKDDRHRTRALQEPDGREIGIVGNPAVFALIGTIQEETHRFAIEYHRSLRRGTMNSTLDGIAGVGEKRRNDLLKAFKSISAIREASVEQLNLIVPKNAAQAVYDHFHSADEREENK
ncbi:MAG: excinuclease ABC subunit UvrC [Candidatus Heteroscillospira sp.]|jgi:excinuclease ABC subunit C